MAAIQTQMGPVQNYLTDVLLIYKHARQRYLPRLVNQHLPLFNRFKGIKFPEYFSTGFLFIFEYRIFSFGISFCFLSIHKYFSYRSRRFVVSILRIEQYRESHAPECTNLLCMKPMPLII